jgi:hypothetical protein
MPLYDLQKVERDKWNHPVLRTDLVTSSKRRIYNRVQELKARKQQHRVIDFYGNILETRDIEDMR